jgi:hypothetical protein
MFFLFIDYLTIPAVREEAEAEVPMAHDDAGRRTV